MDEWQNISGIKYTVYPKKYAHGFCFAVLCCGYTLTDFPISIRLTALVLWQSNDCPSASKATLMNMDNTSCEFIMNDCITTTKQSTTKTVCIFLEIYCMKCNCCIWRLGLHYVISVGQCNLTGCPMHRKPSLVIASAQCRGWNLKNATLYHEKSSELFSGVINTLAAGPNNTIDAIMQTFCDFWSSWVPISNFYFRNMW